VYLVRESETLTAIY